MANLSSENASDIQHDVGWYWFRVFFIAITAFLDIICNIISMIVLPKMKSLPSNNRFLVMISSVLDLTTGFAASVSIAPAILGSWPYGQQICLIYVTSATSSSCTAVILVIFALDRYIAIKKPPHGMKLMITSGVSHSDGSCVLGRIHSDVSSNIPKKVYHIVTDNFVNLLHLSYAWLYKTECWGRNFHAFSFNSHRNCKIFMTNFNFIFDTIGVPYIFRKSIFGWNCDHDTPLCDTPLLEDTPLCDTPDDNNISWAENARVLSHIFWYFTCYSFTISISLLMSI